jgi:DNA-binding SARP family transcriptional activator/Flp pilus assembly protein TadD
MAADDSRGRNCLPRTRKTRALLAVLAIASPKPVLRQHLAALLWSRREQEQARGSLRQSVHELQDTLGPAWSHLFVTDRHHLSLRGAALEIDALSLAQPGGLSAAILDRFEDVLLEDLNGLDPAFDRWLEDERARYQRIGRAIGEGLLAKCGDPVASIDAAEQLLAIDRMHEGAWRAIMRGHVERGDLGAAMACYDRCRSVLAENSDGRPSPETEDLIGRIRAQAGSGRTAAQANGVVDEAAADMLPRTGPRRGRSALRLHVAPLRTIGAETDDGLALGLAEEISAGLSRFRWISCVVGSRSSGFPGAAEAAAGARSVWDADLVLDGTIQHGQGRVRIIVRLIDMRSDGEIAWAGRFDRTMTDPLTMQDELGAAIVAQVDPELMKHEGRRAPGTRSDDMTAQDLLLQALPAIYRLERSSYVDARRLLEASLRADPTNSAAHGWLAYWHLLLVGQGWAQDRVASSAEASRLAERAVMLDPGDARALTLAGHVRGFLGKHPEEARAMHERAIALNPNLAIAWCFSGLSHFYLGQHDEALRRINQAIRLSPSDPHIFFFDMALIMPYMMNGDCVNAIAAGRRAVELNPLFSSTYKGYLAALGCMHRTREASEVLDRLLTLEPGFSVEVALERSPLTRSEDLARYADGLRRAGLRERCAPSTGVSLVIDRSGIDHSGLDQPGPDQPGPDHSGPDHSVIDLAAEAPHSPAAMRDGSHATGRMGNDTVC